MPRPFNIMAKPVCGECNLNCTYCYYTSKARDLYGGVEHPRMSDEVLENYTRQYIDASPEMCTFGWQGGEPLLAGKEFFIRAVDLQKHYARPSQTIENAMQTNGVLLDDEWCEFFAGEKFLVGISLDGPPQWHDRFRRDHADRPTFHRAWAGLERLAKRGVEFNVLVTLNRANAPHAGDIYRYFVNRGVRYVQFIPILERDATGRVADYSCTPEQFSHFLLEVFELWAARDVGKVSERFIDNVIHTLIYAQPAMCTYAKVCANSHVLEFNGDLYACDHFVYPRWRVGNIAETPLVELLDGELLGEFARLKSDLPAACCDCEYLEFCHGGCPKHHIPLYGGADRVNYFCEGYKRFFTAALPELRRMAEYFKRNQTPPPKKVSRGSQGTRLGARHAFPLRGIGMPSNTERKARLQTPPAAAPAGKPKRNDPCPCGSTRKFKNCCGRK